MRLGQWRQERAKVLVAQVEAVGILRQVYGVPERVSRLLELPGHPIASLLDRSDELLVFGRAMDLKEMVRRLPCFDLLLFQERQGEVVVLLIRCLSVRLAARRAVVVRPLSVRPSVPSSVRISNRTQSEKTSRT